MGCANILSRWKRWIRFAVVVIYIVLLVIAVPLCIWELERKGAPDHVQAWFVGGMFVLMALPISFWGILQHVIYYTTPHLQRHIIRILWMVPVYALNAWFALRFPEAAIYLDTLRECYEAYVIYNFMAYLMSFLHENHPDLSSEVEGNAVTFIFPLCLLPPCKNGSSFIQHCKHGVLQYTLVRPIMAAIAFICEMCGKYDEGDFNFTSAWSYIVVLSNFSQIFAMYCLVMFYRAFRQELKPLKPVPKFMCVKAVVFLSFWQGLLIAALAKFGAIPTNGTWVFYDNIKQVSTGIQDFLICIEMFLAAIAHYFSFSHKPFVNLASEQQNCCDSFMSMWDVRDVTGDVAEHARFIGRGMQKTLGLGKRLVTRHEERTPLLSGATSVSVEGRQTPEASAISIDAHAQTTSSMNNYTIFENNAENQLKGLSRSVSLKGYCSAEDDSVDNFEVLQPDQHGDVQPLSSDNISTSHHPMETDPDQHGDVQPLSSDNISTSHHPMETDPDQHQNSDIITPSAMAADQLTAEVHNINFPEPSSSQSTSKDDIQSFQHSLETETPTADADDSGAEVSMKDNPVV